MENEEKKIKQAIALEYDPGDDAPRVIAAGRGALAERIIEKHGVDRILFASDSPWHTPQMELRFLNSMGLSNAELDRICYQNAASLLGLSTEQETR